MTIAITAKTSSPDALIDPRFGRCAWFLITDDDGATVRAVVNTGTNASHGAGIQAAQRLAEANVEVLLTGNCGPKAFQTLGAAGIQVVTGAEGSAREALAAYLAGDLQASDSASVGQHFTQ